MKTNSLRSRLGHGRFRLDFLRSSVLLAFACLCSHSALGLEPQKAIRQYSQDIWTSRDGLPQNTILAISQSYDGYIWLGTEEGLVRFDGVSFTVFDKNNTDELKQNYVSALFEDQEGSLWIGTRGGGLNSFKDGRLALFTTRDGLSNNFVTSLYKDDRGVLWIGTEGGLNRFKDGKFSVFTSDNGLSQNSIKSIYGDKKGNIWIGTEGGLNKFKDGKFTIFTTKEGLSQNSVRSIYADREGSLWIGTDGGLNRFKDGKFTIFTTKDGLSHNAVRAIYEDREGSLWVGTQGGGINRFSHGEFTFFTTRDELSNDFVFSIYEDREGSLWIGTAGGLNRFKEGQFTSYTAKDGLSNDVTRAVYQDKKGSIWIGTQGGGLNRLKDGLVTSFTTKEGLSNNFVRSIYETKEGLWIGTNGGGLNRFKDGKFTSYTTRDGLINNSVWAISEDKEGSLWIGTEAGLNRFKNGQFTTFTTADGLSNGTVLTICESSDGGLWIGTEGGLSRFKNGKLTHFTTNDGLSHNSIFSLYEDKEGTLWIGTLGGGLNRFKNGKFTVFTTKQGLFDDLAFQILEDEQANLWMSCNKGIYRVNKKDLSDFADGRVTSLTSVVYGISDGMKSNECNSGSPSGWRAQDGRFWFSTMKGVVVVDPSNLKLNSLLPPVILESVVLNDKPVGLRQKLESLGVAGRLEFHFTALSFLAPEKVRFKYQLEGFDQDWVDAGTRRVAYYTNLPPGKYRFRVIACNNDGVWNETGASFDFYLKPHFYQTGWFYALCVLAVILLGFGLYGLRVRHLRQRTDELELIVDQRTGELKCEQQKVLKLEKLATEQQMAGGFAHEMRNALAGSKLILDQALALDGPEPHVSLNLANCRSLKEMYLGLKGKLPEDDTRVVLGQMQTIFVNEERLNEVMQLVRKATSRGLNITQQIMDYSKVGQQQAGQNKVDINNLIVSIVNESREEFSSQGVVIEYKSEHQLLTLIGDETHYYSIIKNILLNARDALIDLSVKDRKDRHIEIITALEGYTCRVVITDNGIGIPPENLQQVFEPFFSTKPATGTGLGLGMVKKMVSLYNGSIDVRSEAGKGTSVTISLPVSQQGATL